MIRTYPLAKWWKRWPKTINHPAGHRIIPYAYNPWRTIWGGIRPHFCYEGYDGITCINASPNGGVFGIYRGRAWPRFWLAKVEATG